MTKEPSLMAVDISEPALLEHRDEFIRVGIDVCRVNSMYEAVARLLRKKE